MRDKACCHQPRAPLPTSKHQPTLITDPVSLGSFDKSQDMASGGRFPPGYCFSQRERIQVSFVSRSLATR